MPEFGAKFKTIRESKGLTLDQIAAETRINARFLKAIEDEEFEELPGGIVARGFIRTYASVLELDPVQVAAEFEQRSKYREPPLAAGFRISATPSQDKTTRNFYPVAAGILLLLIVVFYAVTRESTPAVTVTASPPPAAVVSAPPSIPVATPASAPGAVPVIAEAAAPEPTTSPAITPPAASTTTDAHAMVLEIEVTENTWITLTADGSQVVSSEILHPGANRRYSADKFMKLVVGNAGGTHLKLNGRDVPSLGQTGQVRTLQITPETIKDLIP